MFNKLLSREKGQGLVEYALILVLVAIVVIAVLLLLGPQINQAFCRVANVLEPGTCGAITSFNFQVVPSGPGKCKATNISITVSETVDLSGTIDGKSFSASSVTGTQSFSPIDPIACSGSYTVLANGGSKGKITGNYSQ
jgi:pilus assembly protein Flp/PilA